MDFADQREGDVTTRPAPPLYSRATGPFDIRLCHHCDDPPCLAACPMGAMSLDARGVVVIDEKVCTACGAHLRAHGDDRHLPPHLPRPWYTHSTLGSWFGAELKYADFDALVIHAASPTPVCLEIADGPAHLVEADDLWNQDAREIQLQLRERLHDQVQLRSSRSPGGPDYDERHRPRPCPLRARPTVPGWIHF